MEKINIKELAKKNDGEFVSIYLPTHKSNPENQQDRIRFKNLLTQAEGELKSRGKVDVSKFLEEAWKLQEDLNFWNHAADGLAVLIGKDDFITYRTEGQMPERAVVDSRFHLLPLLNSYEFLDDTYVLDISKDRFKFYHGGRGGVEEVETPEITNRFDELFDDKDIQSSLNQSGGGDAGMHGRSSASQIDEIETEKYLRYVAAGISDFLKEKDYRLILFGTTEVVAEFSAIAEGSLKIEKVVDKPLSAVGINGIFEELKKALRPDYIDNMAKRLDSLQNSIAADKGTDNLSLIQKEAENGRIETLFVSSDLEGIPAEELNNLLGNVMSANGEVVLIDKKYQEFPMGAGAVFRY